MIAVRILSWRPYRRNLLFGFVKAEFDCGLVLGEIAVMAGPHGLWCAPPDKPAFKNSTPLMDSRGRAKHTVLVEFTSREIKDQWSRSIIEELRQAYPEFDKEPAIDAVQEDLQ